jgi:hypothetical protein
MLTISSLVMVATILAAFWMGAESPFERLGVIAIVALIALMVVTAAVEVARSD